MVTGTMGTDVISQNGQTWSPILRTAFPELSGRPKPLPPLVSCKGLQLATACLTALSGMRRPQEGRKAEQGGAGHWGRREDGGGGSRELSAEARPPCPPVLRPELAQLGPQELKRYSLG